MKLIKALLSMERRFYTKLQRNEAIYQSLFPLGILCLLAEAIWLAGPYVIWGQNTPLASSEKRAYTILVLFLAWLLKFLLLDLGKGRPITHKKKKPLDKLTELHKRFEGALHFLKKNTIAKQGKTVFLNDLPWYLLIGPQNAGKTTLLANSEVQFILQKQFQNQIKQHLETSENCDWWATREANIIDVPGKYVVRTDATATEPMYSRLWQYFLHLIKKKRGKNGIDGLIIVLPAAEWMKQHDPKSHQQSIQSLLQHIEQIQKYFPKAIPCKIILTKCDLLPGFAEFFAESTQEEMTQTWGIALPAIRNSRKIPDLFLARFNALIKRINQQLLWRLHQERNPTARLYIKDFPLQIERIKEFSLDFIKKISAAGTKVSLQGIYLTSALQTVPENTGNLLESQTHSATTNAVQIFKSPLPSSRPYFIKHLLTHGLHHIPDQAEVVSIIWKRRAAYAASISIITLITVMLGQDFLQGIKRTYAIQKELSDYQLRTTQIKDPTEHFIETLSLLNILEQSTKDTPEKTGFFDLIRYYSHKSQQKSNEIYHQALQTILIPEIKNYMEEYLHHPINNEAEDVYTALKAYLMIGDAAYFNSDYLSYAMQAIVPSTISQTDKEHLLSHLKITLNTYWSPVPLNETTIQQTRSYLLSLPNSKLSYIILKNLDNNNSMSEINLGAVPDKNAIFVSSMPNHVPTMFTSKVFPSIISQQTILATQEATHGNWVLGYQPNNTNTDPNTLPPLVEQLRTIYINNYINLWEGLLNNIHLNDAKDLTQTDAMIVNLISNNSPLLQLLQTFHENTYFEPINTASIKLQNIGSLLNKDQTSQNLLYEIFSSLQGLHAYLQTIIGSENEKKAAFDALSSRMLGRGIPDAITQLRLVAEKSPVPIKNWLEKIAGNSWDFLMQDAAHYLDISWRNEVYPYYQTEIAQHYPFGTFTDNEVVLNHFIHFFGNPGIIYSFYDKYLQPFVDTSNADWHWKKLDDQSLPFSEVALRQIQQALRIHRSFFVKDDNKLHLQFALRPYEFGKMIKKVKLNINDTQFVDDKTNLKNFHLIIWPSNQTATITSVQLTMSDLQTITRTYPGDWGWFKLVNQSFESMINKKEIMLDLSLNEHSAKYLLSTDSKYNPFLSLDMRHFRLQDRLTENNFN